VFETSECLLLRAYIKRILGSSSDLNKNGLSGLWL